MSTSVIESRVYQALAKLGNALILTFALVTLCGVVATGTWSQYTLVWALLFAWQAAVILEVELHWRSSSAPPDPSWRRGLIVGVIWGMLNGVLCFVVALSPLIRIVAAALDDIQINSFWSLCMLGVIVSLLPPVLASWCANLWLRRTT